LNLLHSASSKNAHPGLPASRRLAIAKFDRLGFAAGGGRWDG
jgi:hypothetical protein